MVLRTVNEAFASLGSDSGSPIKNTYMRQDNEDGTRELVKTGEKNIQEEIDSFAEQTDYTKLLERMEKGDPVAAVTAAQVIAPKAELVFGDDSAEVSLRKIADARLLAKKVFESAGGQAALGISFDEFMKNGEVQRVLQKAEPVKTIEKNVDPAAVSGTPTEGAAQ